MAKLDLAIWTNSTMIIFSATVHVYLHSTEGYRSWQDWLSLTDCVVPSTCLEKGRIFLRSSRR